MMLLWRRSLAARFLLLVLFALALSQAITFLISWDERGQALHTAAKGEFVSRTSSLALLLETTPPSLRPDILDVSGTAYTRSGPRTTGRAIRWPGRRKRSRSSPSRCPESPRNMPPP